MGVEREIINRTLQMFAKEMLRKIFGRKKDEVGHFGYCITTKFVMYTGHVVQRG